MSKAGMIVGTIMALVPDDTPKEVFDAAFEHVSWDEVSDSALDGTRCIVHHGSIQDIGIVMARYGDGWFSVKVPGMVGNLRVPPESITITGV